MSRWIPARPRIWIVALLLVATTGCPRRDEAALDAWALWREHEPTCAEPVDAAHAATLSPRWRAALAAMAAETLAVMEERLAETSGGRGENRRLLGELVAESRRLCELGRGETAGTPSAMLAWARAELAATRSRLAVALPMSAEETRRRSRPYDARISNAVSDALERFVGAPDRGGGEKAEAVAETTRVEKRAAVEPSASPAPPAAGAEDPPPAGERVSIVPASGEPWTVIRRRRNEAAEHRLARWRDLYESGLRPVAELRAELAAELRRESLEGLTGLCVRLGRAAERVPSAVVEEAPSERLAADLTALLEAYAGAGRACSAVSPSLAWGRLAAGDDSWREVRRAAADLAARPGVPESLRRDPTRGNVSLDGGVD